MKHKNEAFDSYIANSAPFARPILEKLRKLFHMACPEIEETMKWSAPHYDYKGIVASMCAFKNHVRWGFWKGKLLKAPDGKLSMMGKTGMSFALVADVSELPPDKVILDLIRQAVALNDEGVKLPAAKKKQPNPAPVAPDDLLASLKKNKKAQATFDAMSPSHKREYIEWITEAKQEATRKKRLATAMEWLAEGKSRNWKYTK
jgi:uncharacterized protein YdeI (YjbR/CyaY-like superfamily)